LEFIVIV